MALIKNYAIWNNKGGVGKSTITYHISTRYAELNPEVDVLVIDLCPQANLSMMLLGGGGNSGSNKVMEYSTMEEPQTVVGYISEVLSGGPGARRPDNNKYATQVSAVNPNLPSNLYLLCGDGLLEVIAPAIIDRANQRPINPKEQPWVWVHRIIRNFIEDFAAEREDKDVTVFIDTNPAFGIYTELAITAADELICPVNADDSSRVAAYAMMMLIHGANPPHPVYGGWTFASLAAQNGLQVPPVKLIIGNRFTQYDGAARAFSAMSDATTEELYNSYQTNPDYFTTPTRNISNLDDFRNEYAVILRDFNTTGVVTTHIGSLLSSMHSGTYPVHGENVTLDNRRISDCQEAIDNVIGKL